MFLWCFVFFTLFFTLNIDACPWKAFLKELRKELSDKKSPEWVYWPSNNRLFWISEEVHNYSVGNYDGRDHLSIYLWKFQGDGDYTKNHPWGKGISRKYLNLSVVIHVALDGWNQFCNSTACLNMNCKLKFLLLPAYILIFESKKWSLQVYNISLSQFITR